MNVLKFENRRQRTKSETCARSKNMRKSTEQFSSIDNLEDMLTCSIHLGVIVEPRQLKCGHAFCLSCLENYFRHSSDPNLKRICCPLCRADTYLDNGDLSSLVPAYLHIQLTEYIFKKKEKALNKSLELNEHNLISNSQTFHGKAEIFNDLLNDIKNGNICLEDLNTDPNNNLISSFEQILEYPEFRRIRSKSVGAEIKNDILDNLTDSKLYSFDRNTIRKNMKKYSEYSLTKNFGHQIKNDIIGISWINYPSTLEGMQSNIALIYLVEDSPLIYMTNSLGLQIHSFVVNVDETSFKPGYVKCHSNKIFVSGKLDLERSCLIQLSLNGCKEKISNIYPGTLCGFCFDLTDNSVFIAYPSKYQVVLFDESLQKEMKVYDFGNLSPMFVALSANTREIWVSCPNNNRIAVYDENTNQYLHLATNQIYDSTPTHIIETHDNKLLFLDIGQSRLFWIFRWNNCLFIQLLLVMGTVEEIKIISIESLSNNMILFSDGKNTFVAKPNRLHKDEHQKNKCSLL